MEMLKKNYQNFMLFTDKGTKCCEISLESENRNKIYRRKRKIFQCWLFYRAAGLFGDCHARLSWLILATKCKRQYSWSVYEVFFFLCVSIKPPKGFLGLVETTAATPPSPANPSPTKQLPPPPRVLQASRVIPSWSWFFKLFRKSYKIPL